MFYAIIPDKDATRSCTLHNFAEKIFIRLFWLKLSTELSSFGLSDLYGVFNLLP